jgi:hypothetical protein
MLFSVEGRIFSKKYSVSKCLSMKNIGCSLLQMVPKNGDRWLILLLFFQLENFYMKNLITENGDINLKVVIIIN